MSIMVFLWSMLYHFSSFTTVEEVATNISFDLVDSTVAIVSDEEVVGTMDVQVGNEEAKEMVPTTLYYTFSIQNTGADTIVRPNGNAPLQLKWEPNDVLLATSEEVMGFNLFAPSGRDGSVFGYSSSFPSAIEPNETATFTLFYVLGYAEAAAEVQQVPSSLPLQKLQEQGLEGSLIVWWNGEEVARYHMSANTKQK